MFTEVIHDYFSGIVLMQTFKGPGAIDETMKNMKGSGSNSIISKRSALMLKSWNGSIFRVTGPLCGEFIGQRWISLAKASDVELWCFLWSSPEQMVELTIETPVIWDVIALIMTPL